MPHRSKDQSRPGTEIPGAMLVAPDMCDGSLDQLVCPSDVRQQLEELASWRIHDHLLGRWDMPPARGPVVKHRRTSITCSDTRAAPRWSCCSTKPTGCSSNAMWSRSRETVTRTWKSVTCCHKWRNARLCACPPSTSVSRSIRMFFVGSTSLSDSRQVSDTQFLTAGSCQACDPTESTAPHWTQPPGHSRVITRTRPLCSEPHPPRSLKGVLPAACQLRAELGVLSKAGIAN